jgi:hypothetical protein
VTLLALVCTGESFELAQLFGDDVAFRSGMYHVGPSRLAQMVYVLGQAGSDRGAAVRARTAAGIALTGGRTVEARFLAHCAVTRQVARRLGLPPGVDETPWDRVIAADPSPRPPLTEEELDAVLEVVAGIAATTPGSWAMTRAGCSTGAARCARRRLEVVHTFGKAEILQARHRR